MSAYPSTLPNPVAAGHAPKLRVSASDLEGPGSYASRERSYIETLDVQFFLTAEQASIFYAWWEGDLRWGGAWFNCSWPAIRPGGMVAQFLSEPVFEHVYNGAHRISLTAQVRGDVVPVLGPLALSGYWTLDGSQTLDGTEDL